MNLDEPTPFQRLLADNDDLRARLQLAEEKAFYQAAEIARLRASNDALLSFGIWSRNVLIGDSGAGQSYWEQFREFRDGADALSIASVAR